MSDTFTELQLEKLNQLTVALDELKSRFLSLADAGKALQESFVTATISFLSTPRIAPVFVPNPATQPVNAPPGAGQQGGVGDILLNTGKKAGEKLFDKLLDKLIEKAIGKKTPGDLPTKTKTPIGIRREEAAAVIPSKANTGTKTTIGLIDTIAIASGTDKLRSMDVGGAVKPVQSTGLNVVTRQTPSVIAALPVFVTNWPASFGARPADSGSKGLLEKVWDKLSDAAAAAAAKQIQGYLASAWVKLFGSMGLLEASIATLIATLPVTLPLAAYGLSRHQQQESAGLVKWRTEHPQDYAKQKEIWGIKPVNHAALPAAARDISGIQQDESAINWNVLKFGGGVQLGSMINDLLHPSETQAKNQNIINIALRVDKDNRLYADTNDMGTAINLKRGDLMSTGDK